MLKQAEGVAHADGHERGINVETTRQINARTECLLIEYDVPDTVSGRRKRSYFVRALQRSDSAMTQLSDSKIVMTAWK